MTVSVIIPARNAELWIAETLTSILAQDYTDLDVMVIDDGSVDRTRAIAETIVDPRLRILSAHGSGVAAARNQGIAAAVGEWLAFCDADDFWDPTKLSRQLDVAQCQALDLVSTNCHLVTEGVRLDSMLHGSLQIPVATLTFEDVVTRNPVALSSTLVRADTCRAAGGFQQSEAPAEDWGLWLRLMHRGCRAMVMAAPLTYYRLSDGSASAHVLSMHEAELRVLAHILAADLAQGERVAAQRRIREAQMGVLRQTRIGLPPIRARLARLRRVLAIGAPRDILGEMAFAIAPSVFTHRRPRRSASQAVRALLPRPATILRPDGES